MNNVANTLLLILFLLPNISQGQRKVTSKLTGIKLELDKQNQVFYRHQLKTKETLYSLAKYFKCPVEDLLVLNNIKRGDIVSVGKSILIPINTSEIHTTPTRENKSWIPLIYEIERQETLYKISKNYFPQKMEDLITRNNLKSFSIKQGRKLNVGWWSPVPKEEENIMTTIEEALKSNRSETATPTDSQENNSTPLETEVKKEEIKKDRSSIAELIRQKLIEKGQAKKDSPTKVEDPANLEEDNFQESDPVIVQYEDDQEIKVDSIIGDELTIIDSLQTEQIDPEINYKSGIAIWDKAGFDTTNLFVMHNKAKLNSYIRLKYKVTGREVTAKVICAIPPGLYPDDTDIILTPAVANALGAKDSRFQIQMDFYE